MPRIYSRPKSDYLYADIMCWDETLQKDLRKKVSTKTTDPEKALAFAEQLERAAHTAKVMRNSVVTKDYVEKIVVEILTAASIQVVDNIKSPGIDSYFTRYMELAENKVSKQTFGLYRGYLKTFFSWIPRESLKLDWLTKERLDDYYDHLLTETAPKTAKEKLRFVSRILETAVGEFLESNPAAKVSWTKQKDELHRQPMTLDDVAKIIKHLRKSGERGADWARAVILAVSCGCRLEDAVTIKKSQIEDGILTYTQLKTDKDIVCPIVVSEWLDYLITESEYICPLLAEEFDARKTAHLSSEFTTYVAAAVVKQSFKTFEKSGRVVAQKTFHSLRHTFRTAICHFWGLRRSG